MRSVNVVSRILGAVALSFGIGLISVTAALAHPVGHVDIHAAECPTGAGNAIFEKCHGNGLAGVPFALEFGVSRVDLVTDADGVTGATADFGEIAVSVDPGVAADYLGMYVFCSNQLSGEVLVDQDLDGFTGVAFNLPAHEDGIVACDWYFITPASTGGTTGGTTVTALPATGSGLSDTGSPLLAIATLVVGFALLVGVASRKRAA